MEKSQNLTDMDDLDIFYDEEDEDFNLNKFLSFKIDKAVYGFDILYISDIIEMQEITQVPDMPHFIKGVINLRGLIIPVMDIRLRLKREEKPYDDRTCIININMNNLIVGVIVDTVHEVLRIPKDRIAKPPQFKENDVNEFVNGIGKLDDDSIIVILSPEKILYGKELDEVKKIKENINI